MPAPLGWLKLAGDHAPAAAVPESSGEMQSGYAKRGSKFDDGDVKKPPLERLRALVHAFIRSECDEARMRLALNDAAPFYRDAPEAKEAKASGPRTVQIFHAGGAT